MSVDITLWQARRAGIIGRDWWRPYVARILGCCMCYGAAREFLNPVSSERGGRWLFRISENGLYEIRERPACRCNEVFSAVYREGQIVYSPDAPISENFRYRNWSRARLVDRQIVRTPPDVEPCPGGYSWPGLLFRGPDFIYGCYGNPLPDAPGDWLVQGLQGPPDLSDGPILPFTPNWNLSEARHASGLPLRLPP